MHKKINIVLLLSLCFFSPLLAQKPLKQLQKESKLLMSSGNYQDALVLLLEYQSQKPGNIEIQRNIGICSYQTRNIEQAKKYLMHLQNGKDVEVLYYLAKSFHLEQYFKEAAIYYKKYLAISDKDDPRRRSVIDDIKRCNSGLQLSYDSQSIIVENMGKKINNKYDDFNPIPSPTVEGKLYFSSLREGNTGGKRNSEGYKDDLIGHYFADIFYTQNENGAWSTPEPLNGNQNSPRHDVALGFTDNGSVMLLFKGYNLFSGKILADTFKENVAEKLLNIPEFRSPLKTEIGEVSNYLFHDTLLIFSSRKAGGAGGYDLYVSVFTSGNWSEPMNLGKTINSAYDETSPFLSKDGRTLYFSSNRTESIGNLDIFKSVFDDFERSWTMPKNLGIPINSGADDYGYRLTNDGIEAYFCSDRVGGYGEKDLYSAIYREPQSEQLKALKPSSFFSILMDWVDSDENPVYIPPAVTRQKPITTTIPDSNSFVKQPKIELQPIYYGEDENLSNASNSRVLQKAIEILKQNPNSQIILTGHSDSNTSKHLDLYFTLRLAQKAAKKLIENGINEKNIYLRSCGSNYPIAKNIINGKTNDVGIKLNKRIDIDFVFSDTTRQAQIEYNIANINESMREEIGFYYRNAVNGLTYKVQIAAAQGMLDAPIINNGSDAMIETTPNTKNLLLYTIGLCDEYAIAESLKKTIVEENGIKDAFIVAYINGKRIENADATKYISQYPDILNFIAAQKKK